MEMKNCEPREVFEQFDIITKIPHGSGNTRDIADYLVDFASERGLECFRDRTNNVIIRKKAAAGYEKAPIITLQGHIDMVCAKEADCDIDFLRQGISPYVEGDWIKARGTTLGADDGIGMAMMLAVLNDDSLKAPEIEAIFTADEEVGLIGAQKLDKDLIRGRRLINLDSEDGDVIICGCAGGCLCVSTFPVKMEKVCGNMTEISVSGITGGHSGMCIGREGASANVVMARLLDAGLDKGVANLVSLEGGSGGTAIAQSAVMRVLGSKAFVNEIIHVAEDIREEFAITDPHMDIRVIPKGFANVMALNGYDTIRVGRMLMINPHGPLAMCRDIPGVVQTSNNMAVVSLREDELVIHNFMRSFLPSQTYWIKERFRSLTELCGGHIEIGQEYPGWKYDPDSEVKDIILDAYRALYNEEPVVTAVHAGLECGIISDGIEDKIDCVSMGPLMEGVHSPDERLNISSTEKCYRVLVKTLEMAIIMKKKQV